MENLENVIEAIMFAVGRAVTEKEISEALNVKESEVKDAIKKLIEKYEQSSGIKLVKVSDSYQLVSNKEYFSSVNMFVESSKREVLSTTCLEVLSIIAYNPNITKTEIENIRGINSDSQVARLLEYGLVEEVGRLKLPGRPAIFAVTNEFLKSMGINKVEELPDFDGLNEGEKETAEIIKNETSNLEEEE